MIKIRRGLDLPISGEPEQRIHPGPEIGSVALMGPDYVGLRPSMAVKEGDRVKRGQLLFTDKNTRGVIYTAPAAGVVRAINRGAQRVFQSLVIAIEGDEQIRFASFADSALAGLDRALVVAQLVDSGLWTALRTRPYSRVPAVDSVPHSIFVTAIDSNPLAADPAIVIAERAAAFASGLTVLTRLCERVHLCTRPGANTAVTVAGVVRHDFEGPHPAGLVGTHIHFIDPVNEHKAVWHIGYQDVIAVGQLFTTGRINSERVIALGGPKVANPRLLRTCVGASVDDLLAGEPLTGDNRVISGSVLSGRKGTGVFAWLGRYHNQVSVIEEGRERHFLGYLSPGVDRHSVLPVFLSRFARDKKFAMDSSTNGSERAMVPLGNYEQIMPLDILPTQLLRALAVGDTEMAKNLGCLELDEEDLALCTYACVGKYEYGPILRDNLTRIEQEG
ncbi:MAG: Na(+)-translocating NADH-quinone reductase subunit A [Porticoccaceae bacterium]